MSMKIRFDPNFIHVTPSASLMLTRVSQLPRVSPATYGGEEWIGACARADKKILTSVPKKTVTIHLSCTALVKSVWSL